MVFGSIISSPRGSLSLQQVLSLADVYLEGASKAADPDIAMVLCHDTEVSLTQVKRAAKQTEDKTMRERIATIYIGLGELLDDRGHGVEAKAFYKKSEKWGGSVQKSDQPSNSSRLNNVVQSTEDEQNSAGSIPVVKPSAQPSSLGLSKQSSDIAGMPQHIFPKNMRPLAIEFKPPEPDTRLNDTPQLASCLALLQVSPESEDILDISARDWLQVTKKEQDEQDRLKTLATDVIRAFKRDEFKDSNVVTEVVYLAPVLESDDFRYLLKEFYIGIDQSGLLDIHQLEGLAQLIQGADPGYLDSDDLVKILGLFSVRLRDTHQQSTRNLYQLTLAVSHVLDAMAEANVNGLDRETIHEPLSSYLDELKRSPDSYLVYQAAYAYQALICVPDNETLWQATLRRTGKVIKGVSGLVSAAKGLDLNSFIDGLMDIQQGLAGASEVVQLVIATYGSATSLATSGQKFFDSLKEGLSFSRQCAWYVALRGADTLIREGQLADFRKLVCEAPCRRDVAFQWGVCQRLGDIAANPAWDMQTRQSAVSFLGVLYRDDVQWGNQANIKQWILSILIQLSSQSGESLLEELQKDGDTKKQALYRLCRESGPCTLPLKVALPTLVSPSLLDRVQERPDVEGNLRQLRRQRLKEHGSAVYIPPQAKTNLQARDEERFPLMEKVEEFLESDQKVFLLLGVSGAGKSTFNRQLEYDVWQTYTKKSGTIPLYINLPSIEKPEHDMIAKQLRKIEFTEPQIRELKLHRKFVLICDGYDESQQSHNLYTSNRLNEPGEWSAKMVISCRSEYIGVDYRDRFQPGNRNQRSDTSLLQEAVITPFSMDQVQDYIGQYVSVHRPLWEADEYKKALDLIPGLKELVRNPFLMSLSLEVLPRMVDPVHDLSATHITRVALYDQFIEHWMERGKKRLGEKNLSPQARAAFESLSDEGFKQNGIDYLKRLSVAIYKEQGGQPIVRYSRYKDENSWKAEFFSRDDEKQLLREACPLTRNGNQHRFIHRSLLEYGLALAVFDPQEWKEKLIPDSALARRGSTSSVLSSVGHIPSEEEPATSNQGPDLCSPLAWRIFVNEASIIQFLEERVRQEPLFKQQLLDYIEQSKIDKKWRTAAANAITILVRAGVQFNGADLRGIQIPKADLSYGMFDSVQLQGADLRHVSLRCAWLQQANLSKARMTGVQFGELPLLRQEEKVTRSVYSPNGKSIAIILDTAKIKVYSTLTWNVICILGDHGGAVLSVAYSLDGSRIASCSEDRTVRLWDVETGDCRHVLYGHHNYVKDVAYSPREDQIASVSLDKRVKLWDVATGDCLHTLTGHQDQVICVVYSHSGNQVASGSKDKTAQVWNTETGECLRVLSGHSDWVRGLAYSPQGDIIASASADDSVRLWDVATGECRHILKEHNMNAKLVLYSPKGDQVASDGRNRTVRLWDTETGVCLHTLTGHSDYITSIAYSPQGDFVTSTSHDKTIRLWDTGTGVCRQTLLGHSESVSSATFSPSGDQIASSSKDKTVRLWDVGSGISRHPGGQSSRVGKVVCSPNGKEVATCSNDKLMRIWDVETGECLHTVRGHSGTISSIAYSPQGDHVATGSSDNTVRLWSTETGACTRTLSGHNSAVTDIKYSPQGDYVASGSNDKTVRLWDVSTGECRFIMEGHTRSVREVVFSPDGSQIASNSEDTTIRFWDVETGVCSKTLTGHRDTVDIIAYSPQGDSILSASTDFKLRVWDAAGGECRHILTGHKDRVRFIMYSANGDQITSASADSTVKLWDAETGTCLRTFSGHCDEVRTIVYSPRWDKIASASFDRSIRLWDVASGECCVVQDLPGTVNSIEWIQSPGVDCLATACGDGSVWMWEVTEEEGLYRLRLRWSSMNNALTVTDAVIQDVQGLSQLNKQLLVQRGAVGEPTNSIREAGRKLAVMSSVVSSLKEATSGAPEEPVPDASVSVEQLEERAERATDPLLRDILAVVVKDIHGNK